MIVFYSFWVLVIGIIESPRVVFSSVKDYLFKVCLSSIYLYCCCGFLILYELCDPMSATPWTIACQDPLSMEFSRQEYLSRLPFPSPRDFVTQGLNPCLLCTLHGQADSLPPCHLGSHLDVYNYWQILWAFSN